MSVKFEKDLTAFASYYFEPRNGYKFQYSPINGRNFTNETLHYMTKPNIAVDIMNNIEAYTQGQKILMIEVCAGIGGNTLEFLSRKNTTIVFSFEQNEDRAVMLQRNILGYGLGDKAIVYDTEIKGDEEFFKDYKDIVFYMDPPWLPSDLKEAGTTYHSQYITKDIKVGDLTIEQWLEKLQSSTFLAAFRLPPKSELKPVPGWTYEIIKLGKSPVDKIKEKDGRLFICINNKYVNDGKENEFGGVIESRPMFLRKVNPPPTEFAEQYGRFQRQCNAMPFEKAKENEQCKMFVKYGFEDPEPLVTEVKKEEVKTNELPKEVAKVNDQILTLTDLPRISNEAKSNLGSAEWVSELQNYIRSILQKFITDKAMCDQLVDSTNMSIWVKCFTHKSIDPDESRNYEPLETVGDAVLGYAFKMFIYEKLGSAVTSHQMQTYVSRYMSKGWQGEVANKTFKFQEWVYTLNPATLSVREDLLEAFTGAIHETANNIRPFLGAYLGRKFVNFICSKIVFGSIEETEPPKTQLKQIFERAFGGQDHIDYECGQAGTGVQCKAMLKFDTLTKLRNMGFTIKNPLGIGRSNTKTVAEPEAADAALKYIKGLGITIKWANEMKAKKTKRFEDVEKLNPELLNSLRQKLQSYSININNDEVVKWEDDRQGNTFYYTLVIMYKNNRKLFSGNGESPVAAKINAIQKFLQKGL